MTQSIYYLPHKARIPEVILVVNTLKYSQFEKIYEYPECNLHVYSAVWTGVAQLEPLMHRQIFTLQQLA